MTVGYTYVGPLHRLLLHERAYMTVVFVLRFIYNRRPRLFYYSLYKR